MAECQPEHPCVTPALNVDGNEESEAGLIATFLQAVNKDLERVI